MINRKENMINDNFYIFTVDYHSNEDKSPIVSKFQNLLLWGFLIYTTFILKYSGVYTKLTGQSDNLNNPNFYYKVSKPQGATATPCTTLTLRHPITFVDDYNKGGLRSNKGLRSELREISKLLNLK